MQETLIRMNCFKIEPAKIIVSDVLQKKESKRSKGGQQVLDTNERRTIICVLSLVRYFHHGILPIMISNILYSKIHRVTDRNF